MRARHRYSSTIESGPHWFQGSLTWYIDCWVFLLNFISVDKSWSPVTARRQLSIFVQKCSDSQTQTFCQPQYHRQEIGKNQFLLEFVGTMKIFSSMIRGLQTKIFFLYLVLNIRIYLPRFEHKRFFLFSNLTLSILVGWWQQRAEMIIIIITLSGLSCQEIIHILPSSLQKILHYFILVNIPPQNSSGWNIQSGTEWRWLWQWAIFVYIKVNDCDWLFIEENECDWLRLVNKLCLVLVLQSSSF